MLPATYQIKPNLENTFQTIEVKEIVNKTISEVLLDKTYSSADAARWCKQISDDINKQLNELNMKRYKHVIQVILGEKIGSGCKLISRCRWDPDTDTYITSKFSSDTMFCTVTVFGVYLY